MTEKFDIYFTDYKPMKLYDDDEDHLKVVWGEIVLGAHLESFWCPLQLWTSSQYEKQWREARARICSGATSTFFVTKADPCYLEGWPVWRLENDFRVHNCYLYYEGRWNSHTSIDPENPYDAVGPYNRENAEGEAVSEWVLPLNAFE